MGGHEDDEFDFLVETVGAGEEAAEEGDVAQEGDLGVVMGFLGLNQTTDDDGVGVMDTDQGRGLLGVEVGRSGAAAATPR